MNGFQKIYKRVALGEMPSGVKWWDDTRHNAVLAFGGVEIPDSKVEEYRRFNLRAVIEGVEERAEGDCSLFESAALSADIVVEMHNGRVMDREYSMLASTSGAKEYGSAADGSAVDLLTTIMAEDVALVRIPRGVQTSLLIDSRWSGGAHSWAVGRVLIVVEEGAEVEVVELCRTSGEVAVIKSREIVVARGARVKVADMVENESGVVVEGRYTLQAEDSTSRALFCDLSNGASRTNIVTRMTGAHAEAECDGVFVASEGVRDIMLDVQHLSCDCRSSELIKGMAIRKAVGSFAGRIYVAPDAQRTDAALLNRNIVLSDAARIYTKPTLEIYADDVKCGHGATVGKLDPEAIYYMRQRGLSEQAARRLQLVGFAAEVVERFGGQAAERMEAAIEQKLQTI